MHTFRYCFARLAVWAAFAALFFASSSYADQLIYIPLDKSCRLLDTRISTGGPGPLTASFGAYLFGVFNSDIESATQHGNAAGCGIPYGVGAVSVSMSLLNTTAAGNISTWSAALGSTAPNIGAIVYNPTVSDAELGQVEYNAGNTTIPVNGSVGQFYLQVANGQTDMTINLIGYWLPISIAETRVSNSVALGMTTQATGNVSMATGYGTVASGGFSTAMGENTRATNLYSMATGLETTAEGQASTAMGFSTTAHGDYSVAIGHSTLAKGSVSTAMGYKTQASGAFSTAMGNNTVADGSGSTAMGTDVSNGGHQGAFIYGDASRAGHTVSNYRNDQFMVVANGGINLYTNSTATIGAGLAPGSGTWTVFSDRDGKTAVLPVDGRAVLKKVVAMPLNTWRYKTQESTYRHMGPMAQDFYAAFKLGESEKGIDTVDADGVALAAIQGLHAELTEKNREMAAQLEEKEAEIVSLRVEKDREIAALRAELTTRLAALESLAGDLAEIKAGLHERDLAPASVALALKP